MGEGKEGKEIVPVFYDYEKDQHQGKAHAIRRCFAILCFLLVIFVIMLGLAALITWLYLRPLHAPTWTVQNVQVPTLNLQFNRYGRRLSQTPNRNTVLLNPLLNADIVFTLQAYNPNKRMKIIYDEISVYTSYANTAFGQDQIPVFLQGYQNTTTFITELKAQSVPVTTNLGTSLQNDILSDIVPLKLNVDARWRAKIGDYKSLHFWVHSSCEITVTAPNNSQQAGQLLTRNCY